MIVNTLETSSKFEIVLTMRFLILFSLGALFAFERLSLGLGRLFEPYIVRLIPSLLELFGDSSPDVREASTLLYSCNSCFISCVFAQVLNMFVGLQQFGVPNSRNLTYK